MIALGLLLTVVLSLCCGLALMLGLYALVEKCSHKTLKVGSCFVVLTSAIYLSSSPSTSYDALLTAAMTTAALFMFILAIAKGGKLTRKNVSLSHAMND